MLGWNGLVGGTSLVDHFERMCFQVSTGAKRSLDWRGSRHTGEPGEHGEFQTVAAVAGTRAALFGGQMLRKTGNRKKT